MTETLLQGHDVAGQIFEQLVMLVPPARQAEATVLRGRDRPEKGMVDAGLIPEQVLAAAYAEALSLPLLDDGETADVDCEQAGLSPSFLREKQCVPLQDTGQALIIAMADPLDIDSVRAMEMASGKQVLPLVATPRQVIALLSRQGDNSTSGSADIVQAIPATNRSEGEDGGTARHLRRLLEDALARNASDVHLEAGAKGLRVRMRIDGLLQDMSGGLSVTADADQILGRLKVLSGLDIAEKRVPQDGRMQQIMNGRAIDMRISVIPGLYGESAVIRLLNPEAGPQSLPALGFHDHLIAGMGDILAKPHGLFLVTGPTGAGKTTTLYALLRQLNEVSRKILTIEDPVEYQLDGIMQVAARPNVGFGFADALRSFLRHDPDVLMVGEIRDGETARVAVQAALTGHLVLSTVHTNDAVGAIDRMLDMGVESYLLASVLRGVLAQRLVRKTCEACCGREPTPARLKGFVPDSLTNVAVEKGCGQCNGTGFRGRFAVGELITMDDRLSGLVGQQAARQDIVAVARSAGFISLKEDGLHHLTEGHTTPDELLRHIGDLL